MTDTQGERQVLTKVPTGIEGLDQILYGGLPAARTTLLAGSSGCGKTICAAQFLMQGARQYKEPGVLVSFEEDLEQIQANLAGFGWDLSQLIEANQLRLVDASPPRGQTVLGEESFDLSALVARIDWAVEEIGAKRIALDTIANLFAQFSDSQRVRQGLLGLFDELKTRGLTVLVTAERVEEHGPVARFGVEEFIADNVIVMRNELNAQGRRRSLEILKYRGSDHAKGRQPYVIDPQAGLVVLSGILREPLRSRPAGGQRRPMTLGIAGLDQMCGAGIASDAIVLVSGATGTGKTLLSSSFLNAVHKTGEKALLFAFEEDYKEIVDNAAGWGLDLAGAEKAGLLKIVCVRPESRGIDEHFMAMTKVIDEFQPDRIVIDSLTAIGRSADEAAGREFIIDLASYIKDCGLGAMMTHTASGLVGGDSVTDVHVSSLTDAIVLLRYVEIRGEMRRGVAVLKVRGSAHDKAVYEYRIDAQGMQVGEPFEGVAGIISGNLTYFFQDERSRLSGMFESDE